MQNNAALPEGFRTRVPGMQDLDEVLELLNLCAQKMTGGPEYVRSTLESDWTTPGFNLETDHLAVYSPTGKLVGYTFMMAITQPPAHPWVWGRIHPEYEGLGLGSYLLAWGDHQARRVLDKVPAEARVSFFSVSWDNYQPANELLAGYGMNLIRHSYQMRIELPAPPPAVQWPQGIRVQTFQMEDLADLYRADEEAFRDHFGHLQEEFDVGLDRFSRRVTNDPYFDPALWFLAKEGSQIAGFCLCRKKSWEDENMGWVSILGVRQPWRKRGLGLSLLLHGFSALWQYGQRQVGLGVDAENLTGALRLYEKSGMHIHRQQNLYEKELRPGVELANISLDN